MRALLLPVVLVAVLAGCSTPPQTLPPSTARQPQRAESPEAAVTRLMQALAEGDLAEASRLSSEHQMVLVALAEGVTSEEALLLLESGASEVGENFWAGFAEGLEDFLGAHPDEIRIGEVERITVEGIEFARVEVAVPLDINPRTVVVREEDGWKVDVIATFASALAGKLASAAETVRGTPEGAELLGLMRTQEASLQVVLQDDELRPELQQAVVSAIEAIRR